MTALKLVATDCDCEACAGPNLADAAAAAQTIADLQRQVAEFSVERAKLNEMITRRREDDKNPKTWFDEYIAANGRARDLHGKYKQLCADYEALRRASLAKTTKKTKPRKKPAKPKRKV